MNTKYETQLMFKPYIIKNSHTKISSLASFSYLHNTFQGNNKNLYDIAAT